MRKRERWTGRQHDEERQTEERSRKKATEEIKRLIDGHKKKSKRERVRTKNDRDIGER